MKIIIEPENGPAQVWSTEPAENRAALYESRAKDLEKHLAEEKDCAEAWELRCGELEQELRDVKEAGIESVKRETLTGLEAVKLRKRNEELEAELGKQFVEYEKEIRELRDRIGEQNWTIGSYDAENKELRERMERAERAKNALEGELEAMSAQRRHDEECRMKADEIAFNLRKKAEDEARELRERLEKCGEKPFPISLNEWASVIHENAVNHGWWTTAVHDGGEFRIDGDVNRPLPEILMLCVCELAESMEEYRDGKPLIYEGENGKPEGIAVEMGDCIIRILDWMGHKKLDVDKLIRDKHEYNTGRPYRHGGKLA